MLFEITPEDIGLLSDSNLRELVGRLAEQEVLRAGHSVAAVTYGGHQNAADGGIDVRVSLQATAEIDGYVPRPVTGYQVKAETMPASRITGEMRPADILRPSIEALGESGGAYVIVSSRDSVSDTALRARRYAMTQAVAGAPLAARLHLDFYDGKRLASWVNQHPGLIPWVRTHAGNPLSGWRPFEDWSSSPSPVGTEYLLDEEVRLTGIRPNDADGLSTLDGIHRLREILSGPGGIVRLLGLSGVGKTRLVQALFDERLGRDCLAPGLAVYADLADEPDPVPRDLLERLLHLDRRCILIIDNCGAELHRKLSSKLNISHGKISLITVEYDISDDEPEHTEVFRLEPASATVLEKILERRYPGLTAPEIRTIAGFSEGNARVAIALANTAHKGDSLANLGDNELFNRLFRQRNEDNPELLKAAKACSLVYSFDGETLDGQGAELPVLASLAGQSSTELYAHVAELRRRQLVQARSKWRALLPHALAHKLAKQALQDIPPDMLKRVLTSPETPRRLVKSFTRRLGCLHDSAQARTLAAEWLGAEGMLSGIEKLNDFGSDLFANLAPIDPSVTLDAIQQAYERSDAFAGHARHRVARVARILRSLAYDPELFEESIVLIIGLARGRDRTNDMDDPQNVFESLFSIQFSGTHATIQQRIDVLRNLARSTEANNQALALAGLGSLLQCRHFHVRHGYDFGARCRDFGYAPRSEEDVRAWFLPAFDLCRELMGYDGIFPRRVREIAAEKMPGIIAFAGLIDEVLDFADSIARSHGWPEGWVAVRKAIRWAEKNERTEIADKLKPLAARLEPRTLAERIACYVAPSRRSGLDIARIEIDSMDKVEEANRQVESECRQIGQELADNVSLLEAHLPDLLHAPSERIYVVADAVARHSAEPELVWRVITDEHVTNSFPDSAGRFLAGFVGGLSRAAPALAGQCLDASLEAETLHPYIVSMQTSAGMDAAGCRRLMKALQKESIPIESYRSLSWGRVCDGLTGAQIRELLLAIGNRDGGLDIALDILQMRTYAPDKHGVVIDGATRDAARQLLDKVTFEETDARDTFAIGGIIRNCLVATEDAALVARLACRLGRAAVDHSLYLREHDELISVLAETFPLAFLDGFVGAMQQDSQGITAFSWQLRDDEAHQASPFHKIDEDALWSWVSSDLAERCVQAAELVPPFRFKEDSNVLTWTPTALRLMREAPDPMPVLEVFRDWIFPSSWAGSRATVLSKRLPPLEELVQDSDERIAAWAQEAIDHLKAIKESCRRDEAAWDRMRDERFE